MASLEHLGSSVKQRSVVFEYISWPISQITSEGSWTHHRSHLLSPSCCRGSGHVIPRLHHLVAPWSRHRSCSAGCKLFFFLSPSFSFSFQLLVLIGFDQQISCIIPSFLVHPSITCYSHFVAKPNVCVYISLCSIRSLFTFSVYRQLAYGIL